MATPQQQAEASTWLDQYVIAAAVADAGTVASVTSVYGQIDDWFDPTETISAALDAAAASRAAQQTQAGMVGEFAAQLASALTGQRPRHLRAVPDYPRDAEPFDVYSRPIFDARDALARAIGQGVAEEAARLEALVAAEVRAEVISLTDAALTRRNNSLAALADVASHYRRAIRPELSETGTCGLCVAAASKIYTIGELMPLHTRCKCVVVPIVDGDDLGERFNLEDMERLYAETPGTTRDELVRTRYTVLDDGELGPVLAPAANPARDRRAAPVVVDERTRAAKELAALEPVLAALEARSAAGDDVAQPLAYQRDRVAKLRRLAV